MPAGTRPAAAVQPAHRSAATRQDAGGAVVAGGTAANAVPGKRGGGVDRAPAVGKEMVVEGSLSTRGGRGTEIGLLDSSESTSEKRGEMPTETTNASMGTEPTGEIAASLEARVAAGAPVAGPARSELARASTAPRSPRAGNTTEIDTAPVCVGKVTTSLNAAALHKPFPIPLPVGAAESPAAPAGGATRRRLVQPGIGGPASAGHDNAKTQQNARTRRDHQQQQAQIWERAHPGAGGVAGVGNATAAVTLEQSSDSGLTPRKPFRSPGRHFRDFAQNTDPAPVPRSPVAEGATGHVAARSLGAVEGAPIPVSSLATYAGAALKAPRARSQDALREPQPATRSNKERENLVVQEKKGGPKSQTVGGVGSPADARFVDRFNLSTYGLTTIEHALDDGYETPSTRPGSRISWLFGRKQRQSSMTVSTSPAEQRKEGVSSAGATGGAGGRVGAGGTVAYVRKSSPTQRFVSATWTTTSAGSSGVLMQNSLDSARGSPSGAAGTETMRSLTQQRRLRPSATAVIQAVAAAERQDQQSDNERKVAADRIGGKRGTQTTGPTGRGTLPSSEGPLLHADGPLVVTCTEKGVWQRQRLPIARSAGSTHSARGSASGSRSRGRSNSQKRSVTYQRSSSADTNTRATESPKLATPKAVLSVYGVLQKQNKTGSTVSKERPTVHKNNRFRGALPIRVFCGTWNCEYQELRVATMVNSSAGAAYESLVDLPQQLPENLVEELLEDEDAWATGTPDEDTDEGTADLGGSSASPAKRAVAGTHTRVPGASADTGAGTATRSSETSATHTSARPGSAASANPVDVRLSNAPPLRMVARGSLQRRSTLSLRAVQRGEEPLRQWVLPGYDVYVITLQETISDSVFHAITLFLRKENGRPYRRLQASEDRISGLGDGAWTQFKSTSIAAWVREDYMYPQGPIELIASKAVPLSVFNGSKGAVSVLLKLWGQHTCFLGCHMPASSTEDRVRARVWILGRLCEWYGGVPNATLDAVFHHVIWMGDFNFRTKQIPAASAVKLLEDGQLMELLQHDECFTSDGRDLRQAGFEEAPITFPPTYKKADGRPPADVRDPRWPEKEYQTKYTVKWYKGRHQEDRIPSWTDRVFKWSLPELRSLLRVQHGMYYSAMPREPSKQQQCLYKGNFLNASDHSPVACCMECFPLDPFYSMPPVFSIAACATQQGSS